MLLRNIGPKIINIGSTILMPGDEGKFLNREVDTPAIHALEKHGFLLLIDEPEPKEEKPAEKPAKKEAAEPVEAAPETEAVKEPVEEKKPEQKKRGTKA